MPAYYVTLTPTRADKVLTGQRVRFTYHEPTCEVRGQHFTTCNGNTSICFKAVEVASGEIFEVFTAMDQTVWVVEVVGEVPEPEGESG